MTPLETAEDIRGLRVLHIVRSLAVGGLERIVVDLTCGLKERGVISYLACLVEPGEWASRACTAGMWCGGLPEKSPLSVLQGIVRFIRESCIDLIHTHNSHPHKYGVPAALLTLSLIHI
ncbi:MAG: glycosyltransferase, partial [Kiritimatiellae bacterium]|nr:glycosyltransferase [Kiritimatiellia bacterium]